MKFKSNILLHTSMKAALLIIAFHVMALPANAQTRTVSNHSVTIHTLGATYNYEQPLSEKMTIITYAGLTTTSLFWSRSGWSESSGFHYSLNLGLGLESRFYYNMEKRNSKGKNTNYNAANYFAVDCRYLFKSIASQNTASVSGILISPSWGIRRVYNGRWLLEISPGINFIIDSYSNVSWMPRIKLKFGIVF